MDVSLALDLLRATYEQRYDADAVWEGRRLGGLRRRREQRQRPAEAGRGRQRPELYTRLMALRAVFFDLDETLLDTSGTSRARGERITTMLKRELPNLDGASFLERLLEKTPKTGWALGVAPLIEELGLLETSLGHKAIELWFFQGCLDLARTLPGAEEALRAISQVYTLGVITNGLEYRQRAKFESLPIHELFDVFLTSEAAGAEKPSPEIFQLALGRAGVLPAEAAFVGDRLDVDVLGAQQAGMTAIWVDHQGRVPAGSGPEPDATFTDFGELPSILLQLEAK